MNKILKAMFCVTFFSVCTRAMGFLLKIYLSRELGSVLLGSYQVAMSIFGVLMTLLSSGIPVVLSRNVSYYSGQNNKKAIGSIVSSGLILTGIICLIVSIVVILFPEVLNIIFTSNASTEMLNILLPALIFSSMYEVFRGALWGEQQFFAISFTEFLEQIIRIIILVILFETTFLDMSLTNKTALSLSIACICTSIIVAIIYFKRGDKLSHPKYEFKKLLKTSTPITAVRTASSVVSSIIAIIIPLRLMTYGYSATEALSEFGIIMGMTFPLIMIPSTLISSLAVTIIPSISEQSNDIDNGKLLNTNVLKSKINFSLKSAVMFSGLLISTFIALGVPICEFLYDNTEAGTYLCVASITMIPLGISQITSSILNAIGLEMKSLKNYIISAILLIMSIYFLPKYIGTYAMIVGYLLMSVSSSILNISMLAKRNLINYEFLKTTIYMICVAIFSTLLGFSVTHLISTNLMLTLIIGGITTLGSTIGLIYVFNIANLKVLVFSKLKS